MSPEAWTFWGLVAASILGVLTAYARKRLGLSDEAGQAVKDVSGKKPSGYDEALLLIAGRVQSLDAENEQLRTDLHRVALWAVRVEGWGYKGWSYAPAAEREDPPSKPNVLIVRLRDDD